MQDIVKTFDLEKPLTFDVSFDVLSELTWRSPYEDIKVQDTLPHVAVPAFSFHHCKSACVYTMHTLSLLGNYI